MKEVGGTDQLTAIGIVIVLAVLRLLVLLVVLLVLAIDVGVLALVVRAVLIVVLIVIHSNWYLLKIGYSAIIAGKDNNIP